jgi:HPt (histidine-containing phosphotransfer) domain-containing protein
MFEPQALREYFVWSSLLMMELDAALAAQDAEWVRDSARELASASRTIGALHLTKAANELAGAPDRWDEIRRRANMVDAKMLDTELALRTFAELHRAA